MSIFASLAAPDDANHEDGCAFYVEDPPGSASYEFSGKPCDCGQPSAPFVYQGSHVLPTDTDERGGTVDLALIPHHITRDGRDDRGENEGPWPWLRLGVNESTVILDRGQVKQIVGELKWWLTATTPRRAASREDAGA